MADTFAIQIITMVTGHVAKRRPSHAKAHAFRLAARSDTDHRIAGA